MRCSYRRSYFISRREQIFQFPSENHFKLGRSRPPAKTYSIKCPDSIRRNAMHNKQIIKPFGSRCTGPPRVTAPGPVAYVNAAIQTSPTSLRGALNLNSPAKMSIETRPVRNGEISAIFYIRRGIGYAHNDKIVAEGAYSLTMAVQGSDVSIKKIFLKQVGRCIIDILCSWTTYRRKENGITF